MATDLTTAANALKEVYQPRIHDQLESKLKTMKRVERTTEGVTNDAVGGKYIKFAIRTQRNHGIGARLENEALPTAYNQKYENGQVSLSYQYGAIRLSGQAFELARSDRQAFASLLDQEMNGIEEGLRKDVNRQIYGTSIGKLATANAAGTTTTFVCSNAEAIYLEVGMVVDDYTSADALRNSGSTITNIQFDVPSAGQTTVTFSPAATATASGDYMVRDDSRAKEITGFRDVVQSSGTLYTINPATVPVWTSEVDDPGSSQTLSEGRMITMIDRIDTRGGEVTVIFCSKGVRRAYFNLLQAQRQFVNTKQFDGGFSGLGFETDEGELPVVSDNDCPSNQMYFLNEAELRLANAGDWDWMDRDGSMWQRVIDSAGRYDAYEAILFRYFQLFTFRRNSHGAIRNITEN